MDDRAGHQEFGKSRAYSTLDWPTSEMLAQARRLRGKALREMAGNCSRWLRHWLGEHLLAASRSKANPAKVRIARRQ
jgi:hypothetical protein